MIKKLISEYRCRARKKRSDIFHRFFSITPKTKILDIGSEDGSNIATVLRGMNYAPENIYIADINGEVVRSGHERYGFTPVLIGENGNFSYPDKYFDIVYSSSVIEHVTVPKESVWDQRLSQADFISGAHVNQKRFADEVRRLGEGYFLQTPNRYFVFESHTWLPFIGWFSWNAQRNLIKFTNIFWLKKTIPDFYLLTRQELQHLFPKSLILPERSIGHVKSWMCIKPYYE